MGLDRCLHLLNNVVIYALRADRRDGPLDSTMHGRDELDHTLGSLGLPTNEGTSIAIQIAWNSGSRP